MYVIKRDNTPQKISFDKIVTRLNHLIAMEPKLNNVNAIIIAQKVIAGVYDHITTTQLDELAADASIFMSTTHYDYATLASRIAISNLHKQTSPNYLDVIKVLEPMLDPICIDIIYKNIDVIQNAFDYTLDYTYDFFGFKTLCKLYLLKYNNVIVERPQHLLMRVAIGIHRDDINMVLKSYHLMSRHYFTHATPTLFNSCTKTSQLASCFLMTIKDDSVEGIYDTLKNTALISKFAGGIGVSIHNVRAKGSKIKSNGGEAEGIVPMLKTFNATACHINQASKRKGSFAFYLEIHHPDIMSFLDLKKNNGPEELRCRDLFYALWVSDLFMNRVKEDQPWSLFCPDECPGLDEVYGDDYKKLYESYEAQGKARKTMRAQELWNSIIVSQIETGTPYVLYKDTINTHNNQSNLGTLKSSNLCAEVCEYTSPDEISVCTLASIGLPAFVKNDVFDHQLLYDVCYHVTHNLNRVIEVNFYPVKETRVSNMKHRPIGIGIQGLADVFIMLRYPYDSKEAKQLNQEILETMYFASARASCDLAKTLGPYESFPGSPASKGLLTPDLWQHTPTNRWNFIGLRQDVIKFGLRNSLLIALMPTASTSSIINNTECFEPITSNI
jgi:ribonucleoside-diphosphate reductase alpha chain